MSKARRPLSPEARAYAGLCVATVCWGAAFIAGKVVLAELQPLTAAGWRHFAAALVLVPFAWRARARADLRAAALPLMVMVVCGGVLYQWVFMAALQRTSATNTALLVALNPALTFLLAPLVGEAYSRRGLTGIGLALSGAVLVITHGDLGALINLDASRVGDLLALSAAALWATFNLATRRVVLHLPHAVTNALTYGTGSLVLLALALPEAPVRQLVHASEAAIGALLFMVVFSSVIAGQLFLYGVHTVGVGRTVVFIYLIPVVAAGLSALLLAEPLLPAQIVGGAGVLAGLYVATSAPARAPISPPLEIAPESAGADGR